MFYSYKSFPDVKVWETSFFSIKTDFYSWFDFAWYFANKFVPLYFITYLVLYLQALVALDTTCANWHVLFPIMGLINENRGLDELELYLLFPLMMVLVPSYILNPS